MKDKKQDVNVLEELSKAADEFRKWAVDFGNKLSKVLADIQTSKKEENTWEMKCPYKDGDEYYLLKSFGDFQKMKWTNHLFDELAFMQGNIFTTEEAVNLEVKRRNLLTRFKSFRDECNDGWKPNFKLVDEEFYFIIAEDNEFLNCESSKWDNAFNLFGYFKNISDAQRAIELFGEEIIELFMKCEG